MGAGEAEEMPPPAPPQVYMLVKRGCTGITRSMCEPGAADYVALMAQDLVTPANNSGYKIRG